MSKGVRQHDQRDCGAACLATICRKYGLKLPLADFRRLTKTDSGGSNIFGIVDAAKKVKMEAVAYEASVADFLTKDEITFPCIARIINDNNQYHFVVVEHVKKKHISIWDPAKGRYVLKLDDFNEIYTGYIIICTPNASFRKKEKRARQ